MRMLTAARADFGMLTTRSIRMMRGSRLRRMPSYDVNYRIHAENRTRVAYFESAHYGTGYVLPSPQRGLCSRERSSRKNHRALMRDGAFERWGPGASFKLSYTPVPSSIFCARPSYTLVNKQGVNTWSTTQRLIFILMTSNLVRWIAYS